MTDLDKESQDEILVTKNSGKLKVAVPEAFDGNRLHYRKFRREFRTWLMANPNLNDTQKTLFVLSYMTKGFAETWGTREFEGLSDDNTKNPSFDEFLKKLDNAFLDTAESDLARNRITSYKQLSLPTNEFFIRFEQLALQAGYDTTTDAPYLIQLIKTNAREIYVDRIYDSGSIPDDYDSWKKRLLTIDDAERQKNERKRQTPQFFRPPSRQPQKPTGAPNVDKAATPYGYTGVAGEPMLDVRQNFIPRRNRLPEEERLRRQTNRLCYICAKSGHFSRQCPDNKPAIGIRQVEQEEIEELKQKIRKLETDLDSVNKKKDF
jgi:Zinc knuckle